MKNRLAATGSGHLLLLLAILLLAAGLRFYGLTERGLFNSDEGIHLLGVRSQRAALDWGWDRLWGQPVLSLREAVLANGGTNITYAKPGYDLLILITSFLLGLRDYTSLVVSATAGLLTVMMVYLVARQLYRPITGLVAAGILATLNYHVTFSRAGLSVAASIFFVMLGFYCYLQVRRPGRRTLLWLCLAGVSIGYAFTNHYNLFYVPLVFGLSELILWLRATDRRKQFKELVVFGLAMLVPLLFFELIYGSAKAGVYASGFQEILARTNYGEFRSYFEQIWFWLQVAPSYEQVGDWLFYPRLIIRYDGYLIFGLFLVGLGVALANWRSSSIGERIALNLLFVGFILWSFVTTLQVARAFLLVTPLLALFAAKGVVWLTRGRAIWATLLTILVMSLGFYQTIPTLQAHSGYREATDYMQAHLGLAHISTIAPISRVYTGDWRLANRIVSLAEAQRLHEEGFQYLLLDQDRLLFPGELTTRAEVRQPVFETAHSTEMLIYDENLNRQQLEQILNEPRVLRVYELGSLLE